MRMIRRLLDMSPREILHRGREKALREAERFAQIIGPEKSEPLGSLSWQCLFRSATTERFYHAADTGGRDRSREFVQSLYPDWTRRAADEAAAILDGRLEILGRAATRLHPGFSWHNDPVSGFNWERRFWADYDLVTEGHCHDPKFVHELNRHQHLARLAKAYFLTGREEFALEVVTQLVGWVEQNPPKTGIHWHSSLEIGIRCLSWLWAISFVSDSPAFDERAARTIGESLERQLAHVHRYPSVYSSPNTHLIGEAAALVVGGLVLADRPAAATWVRDGMSILLKELQLQVLADGVHGELSTYYHCYAIDFYVQAFVLAEQRGIPPPRWAWARVEQMIAFLGHVAGVDGELPRLGDDDGGRALALGSRDYRYYGDGLVIGAILFSRSDFKYLARRFREEAFWMLGVPGWRSFEALASRPPANRHFLYPDGGYAIQRSGWGSDATQLIFDCGALGILTGAHAHADSLSIILRKGGEDLLIDPGTYQYGGAEGLRTYFRSTRAHNTVSVDGLDQSRAGNVFSWERRAETSLKPPLDFARVQYVDAEHSGYRSLADPVSHRRRVMFADPYYWILIDEFDAESVHQYDFHFHFAPEIKVLVGPSRSPREVETVGAGEHAGLLLFSLGTDPVEASVLRGRSVPPDGWMSESYGTRRPSPILRTSMIAEGRAAAITCLFPIELSEPGIHRCFAREISAEGDPWLGYAIRHGEFVDLVFVGREPEAEIRFGDCRMRGEFFWMRTRSEQPIEVLSVRGLLVEFKDTRILESEVPESAFFELGKDWVATEHTQRKGRVYVRHLWDSQVRQ